MTQSVFDDVEELYKKFNLITGKETPHFPSYIPVRLAHLKEELKETEDAIMLADLEETVDGLIDLIVIAAGTLAMMGVDGQKHWNEVQRANMSKERGVHPKRGHAYDMIKPDGWIAPNHKPIIEERRVR